MNTRRKKAVKHHVPVTRKNRPVANKKVEPRESPDAEKFRKCEERLKKLSDADLAKGINGLVPKIDSIVAAVRKQAAVAVNMAIKVGLYLLETQARVKHGKWLPWLKKHCADLSQATAYRYMKLAANLSRVINSGATGLKQAYLLTGILPEAKPEVETDTDSKPAESQEEDLPLNGPADFLANLKSSREFIAISSKELPLEKFEPAELDELRGEMASLIESCKTLIEKVDEARKRQPGTPTKTLHVEATVIPDTRAGAQQRR